MTQSLPTRRQALLAGPALLGGALASPAIAQGAPRVLRMATSWPEGLRGLSDSATRLAETITRGSRGKLEVRVGWAGAFVAPLAVHEAAGSGVVEMYHSAEYYFQSRHRALNFFTTVPFGLTTPEQAAWTRHGGGQALWDELNAQFGVKSMPVGGTGSQMMGWFHKDLTTLEDFKGLRLRMPGLASHVIARLGAEPVSLSGANIVKGMMTGTLDGTEWVGPYNDREFGLQKLASRYYYPGFQEPGTMASLGFNLDVWNSLSESERGLIETAAEAELSLHTGDYYGKNGAALASLVREDGITPRLLPDEIWTALAKVSQDVLVEIANETEISRRVYDSYTAYRQLVGAGSAVSQSDYILKRGLTDLFSDA